MVDSMKLCDKIAKLRKRKGLSQEELANELEVSRQSVFKWEAGENTPDLEKIKKLAKLFNVSFDILLDDDKDLEETSESSEKPAVVEPARRPIKFRKTYDSGIKLNSSAQADYEHGYADGKKKIEGYSITSASARHKELISKKGYTKTIRIQHDILVDFFVDDKNKTFGFFFDGAPQFLCPFENFAAFSVTNDGPSTGFTRTPMVGVGIGKNPSIGVGSMPLGHTRSPLRYDCSISYFDENGALKDYKIAFSCNRMYIVYDGTAKSTDELFIWENALSANTNKNLNEVSSYLNGIKEAGNQIKNGDIVVGPIDTAAIASEVRVGQDKKRTTRTAYASAIQASSRRKKKGWLIAFIVVAVLIAGTITTCSISKAVKENQIAETNRNEAQKVIDLIDAIGEVTLSSGPAITRAENAYNALTSDQKALVTNYSKLTAARSKYEQLQYEQREEETKDDPTRTIVVTDLNGRWESNTQEWAIANFSGGTAVLYWVTGQMAGIISGNLPSSYCVGYNNQTRRMEIKLYHYTVLGGEWLDVTMTKSSTSVLALYFRSQTFHKTSNS